MTTRAKLTVYSALATALAALCLTPLLTTKGWITHALLVVALIAAAGAGLRRTPFYRWTVPLGQLIVLFLLLLIGFAGATNTFGGLVPGTESVHTLGRILGRGLDDIQEYAIPAPPNPGLRLILVGSVGLIAIAVDTIAVTYRRSALAGLPLLALYSVGNGLAGERGSWIWFGLAAVGYLVLLFAEGQDRVSRWGRVFRGTSRGTEGSGSLSVGGQRVGVLALAMAMLLPVFLPHWEGGLLHTSPKGGNGPGVGGVTSLDPLVTLESAITTPRDIELLTYRMDSSLADTTYIRTGSLDAFDGTAWKLTNPATVDLKSTLNAPEGLRELNVPAIDGDFQITDRLESTWLPMPYPARSVKVPNQADWRVDTVTGTVIPAKGKEKAVKGLHYQVTAYDVRPTDRELQQAPPAPNQITQRYTDLPRDLPPVVRKQAEEITRNAHNAYDKARALQNFFTGPDFTYDTSIKAGTGSSAIEVFLRDRRGFCVHFASTMAAMSRALGIPARVAVGFTPGNTKGGDVYSVTGLMYHAWPELYFEGYGWMRFEPTKSRGVQPRYTAPVTAPTTAPTASPTVTAQSSAPVALPSSSSDCDAKLRRTGDCGDQKKTAGTAQDDSWLLSWQALATLAGVLVLIALLLVPACWRTLLRRRRLGAGGRRRPGGDGPAELTDEQVLAAWAELVDSAWDVGIPPDESRTPRAAARRIAESAELDAASAAAAGRVALATERVLYARSAEVAAPVLADVRTARDGLRAGVGRVGRTRALLLPPSSAQLWWRISDAVLSARLAGRRRVARATGAVTGPVRRAAGRLRRGGGSGQERD
ncbi:transglutaminaseTgpA domain-containing protein [Kitasatospora sp. NPDC127111]|uniref:transglutaminase family protein n=1 Tax=Kitasatospora sp. NPDC127111 TaxID=3345363 RepID=UPI00362DC213